MKQYDVVIIGGSFSGLSCAQAAAARGLRTVVFDRKPSPSAATQSTGIFVKEIADEVGLPERLIRRISGIRLYAPNMNFVDLTSPNYHFVATDTHNVLKWMARQAWQAGAILSFDRRIRYVREGRHTLYLPEAHIACRYLVGADGARSHIAKQFGLGINERFLLGIENEIDGFERLDQNFMHVFLDPILAPGYIGWAIPGVRVTQVGLATRYPTKPDLRAFVGKLQRYFGGNFRVSGQRAGLIPCGGVVSPWAKGNVCLLGDAAGMVSPLTAGGIHPAIEIGHALGEAIHEYLAGDGVAPQAKLAKHVPRYRVKRNLRRLFDTFTPPTYFYNHAVANPVFRRLAQVIFFHHRGLFSKEAWRDILWNWDNTK